MAWKWNGTSGKVTCPIGTSNQTGAWTKAFLLKRNATGAVWHALASSRDSGGTPRVTLEIRGSGVNDSLQAGEDNSNFVNQATTFATTTKWYGLVISHAASSVPRLHWVNWTDSGAGTALTHADFDGTLGNSTTQAGGTLVYGEYNAADDWFDGWHSVIGEWTGIALSDTQSAELFANGRTSDWWNCSAGRPSALFQPRGAVSNTAMTDLAGNGSTSTAVAGVTDDSGTDPSGWSFDGVGGGGGSTDPAKPAIVTPSAAVFRANGWW